VRIVTWNVNSLRARLPRVLQLLAEFSPDVLCLQETKSFGMRIDHVLLTPDLAARLTACDIGRDYRKGAKPSDHAPLVADLA
jgi:exonuclease III